jgi:hypothetical protein
MFWIGFIVGLFVGANVGIIVAAFLLNTKRRDNKVVFIADPPREVISN